MECKTKSIIHRVGVGTLAVVLGACTAERPIRFAPSALVSDVPQPEEQVAVARIIPTPPPPLRKPVRRSVPTAVDNAPPPTLAQIVGIDRNRLAVLLGNPTDVQQVPPAETWQYAIVDCVMDVFFYLDLSSDDFRALSYRVTVPETVSAEAGAEEEATLPSGVQEVGELVTEEACFQRLVETAADRRAAPRDGQAETVSDEAL